MRLIQKFLLLMLCMSCALVAAAEGVTFTSASPYQLGDLLSMPNPRYDVTISAELLYPDGIETQVPAFVFMHGSGGQLRRHLRYLDLARSLGFATFQVDSFGPRGVSSTVGNQTNVTAAMMTTDLLRAVKFLAAQPRIDSSKIVVMGSSKGAVAALYATWTPIREKIAGSLGYVGYILLYPLCVAIEDARIAAAPVRVFIGEQDNWTPATSCVEQVNRMKNLGRDWTIILYKGAYHGFDSPVEGIRLMPSAYSMVECSIALRADGYEYEVDSGYLLTKTERSKAFRSCARKGSVKIGGYHAVGALLRDVEAVLRSVVN